MKKQYKYPINYYSVITAITSFFIGTLIFLLFKDTSDTGLIAVGYFYTCFAVLVNGVLLVILLINMLRRIKDFKEHLSAICIVLLNIPITLFYLNNLL